MNRIRTRTSVMFTKYRGCLYYRVNTPYTGSCRGCVPVHVAIDGVGGLAPALYVQVTAGVIHEHPIGGAGGPKWPTSVLQRSTSQRKNQYIQCMKYSQVLLVYSA